LPPEVENGDLGEVVDQQHAGSLYRRAIHKEQRGSRPGHGAFPQRTPVFPPVAGVSTGGFDVANVEHYATCPARASTVWLQFALFRR
jgi:hypothetical protein